MKKVKYSKESLCTFMNSAMNIEYVSLILVGIQSSFFDRVMKQGRTPEEYYI